MQAKMHRKILHLDLDAFFCAVEEQHDPSLRGKAFAVGGQPDERGVVASCSYAARRFGIHSAMPMARAVRLCPELIIIPQHYGAYEEASRRVMGILHEVTPLVEQLSIDEAFLDVSERVEPAEELARRLQQRIEEELGLPCSLGVASNKLVAKMANNVGKAKAQKAGPPKAIQVVEPGEEAAFLVPLPVRELWGVGPKTAEQLAAMGIHHIGDLARHAEGDLIRRFGKLGADLARRAKGIDERPVVCEHELKSISREVTFVRDVSDREELIQTLRKLSEGVGKRLRKENVRGATIQIKLRWADFTTLTRQTTLGYATDQDDVIAQTALQLFEDNWPPGQKVRLLGVGVSGFEGPIRQLSLWEAVPESGTEGRLQEVVDELRDRFGEGIIRRASELEEGEADEGFI